MPHSPYLFKANGEPQSPEKVFLDLDPEFNKLPYVEQLQFVNKKTQEVIDKLLSESNVQPIIIIQSDHGARMGVDDWNTAGSDEKLVKRIISLPICPELSINDANKIVNALKKFIN